MKKGVSDDELRAAHRTFEADHERLRGEILSSIPADSFTRMNLRQASQRMTWVAIGLSACLMIAVVGWLTFGGGSSHQVYALDGIEDRFQQIRSLHVKWTSYQIHEVDGKDVAITLPIEWYAERPGRCFHTGYGIEIDQAAMRVRKQFSMIDGNRELIVSETEKTASRGKLDPLATELKVEFWLQNQWMRQIICGPTSNYRPIGTEKVKGQKALKYEYVRERPEDRKRYVIWMNAVTGLPARSAIYEIDSKGNERLSADFETIEINVPPPAGMFTFEPPEGFRLIERDVEEPNEYFNVCSGGAMNDFTASRYPLAIDRSAVLVCWYHGVRGVAMTSPEDDPIVPRAELHSSSGIRECEVYPLRAQLEGDQLWRWSLAVPIDHLPVKPGESFRLSFKFPSGSSSACESSPLYLDDARLKKVIDRLRELGPAAGEIQPEMTLVRLRWLASRHINRKVNSDPPGETRE